MLELNPPAIYEKEKNNLHLLQSQKPELHDYTQSTVIVDGCPITGPEKFKQLLNILTKTFSQSGKILSHDFPVDGDNKTLGFIFFTYASPKVAKKVVLSMNGVNLDKNHTFKVCLFSNYEKMINVKEEWTQSKLDSFKYTPTLKNWLQNEFSRDQFLVLVHGEEKDALHEGKIFWFTNSDVDLVKSKVNWTKSALIWSPYGTYLANVLDKKIVLHGGDDFEPLAKFTHSNVSMLNFSPKEKFLITAGPSQSFESDFKNANPDQLMCDICFWDIRKMVEKRSFTMCVNSWPVFKWSYDDEYFACIREGSIYVYETVTFKLLNKTAIKVSTNNIAGFSWSPTDNKLVYWVPEGENIPSRVVLIEVPSFKELCSKNLFLVQKIDLKWQQSGDYLAIEASRYTKKKMDNEKNFKFYGLYISFDIVRMREKEFPVDSLTIKDSNVACFSWEPVGNKFAYLTTNLSTNHLSIHIHQVTKYDKVKEIGVITRASNRYSMLKWCPKGNVLVAAALGHAEGKFEFFDANECDGIKTCEHAMLTGLYWDPTGRYLVSSVDSMTQKKDSSLIFWTSYGKMLHKLPVDSMRDFRWRPRPPTVLSHEEINNVKKNLSKYSTKLEQETKMLASAATRNILEKRKNLLAKFNKWHDKIKVVLEEKIAEANLPKMPEEEMCDDIIEVFHEVKREVYKGE